MTIAPHMPQRPTSHQARRPGVFGAERPRQQNSPTSPDYPAFGVAFTPEPGSSARLELDAGGVVAAEHTRPTLRPQGFTLLEILVTLGIISFILGISIISISGVQEEDRLRRAVSVMETTARANLLQAVKSQQLVRMPLSAGAFGAGGDFGGKLEIRRVGEREFRSPRKNEIWEFNPTGICEPIEVRISGSGGTVELAFDALTACAKRKVMDFKG